MSKTTTDIMLDEACKELKNKLIQTWARHIIDVYMGYVQLEEGEELMHDFEISDETLRNMVLKSYTQPMPRILEQEESESDTDTDSDIDSE